MIQYLSLFTFTHNHRICLDHYLSMTETRLRISITNTRTVTYYNMYYKSNFLIVLPLKIQKIKTLGKLF